VVFTPTPDYNGPASFTYTISDGNGGTATATVNVTVSPVNDAPVAADDLASTPVNTPISGIAVLSNDSDVEGDLLTVTSATVDPAQGTVTVNQDGTLNFTPALNFSGPAVITYATSDGKGGTATATLRVNVGANTAPDSANASRVTAEDTPVTLGTADFAFSDPDAGQSLANVRIDSLPAAGVLSLNGVAVTAGQVLSAADIAAGLLGFAPALNGNGVAYASFTFSVQDSAGAFGAAPNSVTFDVAPLNDAPLALDDTLAAINEDTPVTIVPATLLDNDSDVDGDALSITSVQAPVGGTVTLSGGNVVFTPTPDYNGPASFTYTISDGNGGTATATVNVTVSPVNDAPVAVDDAVNATEDTLFTSVINLQANDTDVDGNALTVTPGSFTTAQGGTIVIAANGSYTYTPALNFNGTDTVNYTVTDGTLRDIGQLTLTVGAVNDAPVAVDDLASTPVNTPISGIAVLSNDSDVEGDLLTVTSATVNPAQGTVTINPDGTLNFMPALNFSGPAVITYATSDGKGGTATGTVNVAVAPKDSSVPPINPYIGAPTFSVPPPIITTDPALHVLYSVNDVRVDTGLRAGLGIFQTDSATLAELSSEQALLIDTLTAPRGFDGLDDSHLRGNAIGTVNALFVQHAVRHEALVSETGIFVQNAVRSSQLESLARNIRIDSFNSAIPGVGTLLDPFAIGAPSATPATEATPPERQLTSTSSIDKPTDVPAAREVHAAEPGRPGSTSDDLSARPVKRRAADGFGTQLRRNASTFRTSAVRPETPPKETNRVTR
jgi:hypothetical protein